MVATVEVSAANVSAGNLTPVSKVLLVFTSSSVDYRDPNNPDYLLTGHGIPLQLPDARNDG